MTVGPWAFALSIHHRAKLKDNRLKGKFVSKNLINLS